MHEIVPSGCDSCVDGAQIRPDYPPD